MRSLLFAPGGSAKMMAKAAAGDADAVIFDLEDAVHPDKAGVLPIDAVFTDFRDPDGLAREADAARRDGFGAKAAIHPSQVAIINKAFTYTQAERDWAQRVVSALQTSGSGVVQIDGVMIDAPHLAQAKRILAAPPPRD